MLDWRKESGIALRYSIAGLLNTFVGLSSIFALTYFGLNALLANILGFAFGLCVAFVNAKKYVFRSKGSLTGEGLRYMASFGISYAGNFLVLLACLYHFHLDSLLSQAIGISTYVVAMFLLSRLFVFSRTSDADTITDYQLRNNI